METIGTVMSGGKKRTRMKRRFSRVSSSTGMVTSPTRQFRAGQSAAEAR